jgi:3-hydroxybutyryl-CoA dehydrogenase
MNRSVSVIGAGTMGNGIAHVFAKAGYDVTLIDISAPALEKGLAAIRRNLEREVAKEKITAGDSAAALARITPAGSLNAVKGSGLVIEAASENVTIKEAVFRELDQVADGDAILATNTSSISITRLASVTKRPGQVIGMHFMNPVPVMVLVEVIRGHVTSDATNEAVLAACRELGKTPLVSQDYPGFVANRILMPMINEAVFTLFEGVATREAIDGIMKLGMAHPMGPLTLADFIGLDVCLAILEVLHTELGDPKYRPCPLRHATPRPSRRCGPGRGAHLYGPSSQGRRGPPHRPRPRRRPAGRSSRSSTRDGRRDRREGARRRSGVEARHRTGPRCAARRGQRPGDRDVCQSLRHRGRTRGHAGLRGEAARPLPERLKAHEVQDESNLLPGRGPDGAARHRVRQ